MRDLFNRFHLLNMHVSYVYQACVLLWEHVHVCMYLTQLFSAPHLSEALLSRECVRIGWLGNAAKGRLGAPYFSWEKSEGCSTPPTWSLTLYKEQGHCPSRPTSEGRV